MTTIHRFDKPVRTMWALLLVLVLVRAGTPISAETQDRVSYAPASQAAQHQQPQAPSGDQKPLPPPDSEERITPEQAQELFRSVDEILNFASKNTKLPIKSPVKRELAGRDQVRKFVLTHMQEDKDAQRLQRSEASMKKFGLLPQEFDLRKFLVDLLEDQVAGYYDPKTKTVYLLDWVTPEAQRPVLAHELTHALQDQNFGLEKWLKVRDEDQPGNPDNLDAGPDEEQSARQAVSEGQGMAVMMDYVLAPTGQSLVDMPAMGEIFKQQTMDRIGETPIMASSPMYLREMVIFPYTYGLSFLEDLLGHGGKELAFAGAFKNPPRNTREIMEPDSYLDGQHVEPLRLPKLSDILKKNYVGYDSGAVGEFDVYVLLKQYSGPELADKLSPAWRGGVYYLGRQKDAAQPKSDAPPPLGQLGLIYVSNWATAEDAGYFAKAYSLWLPKKYKSVKAVPEQKGHAWTTEQGPVYIGTSGTRVLVTEGLEEATASAIRAKVLGTAPRTGEWMPLPQYDLAMPAWAVLRLLY